MADVQIVRASWHDVPALVRLDRRCFAPVDAFSWLEFLGLCTWPGVVALKAIAGEQLIGFVAGDPRPRERHTIIVTLGVDPDWRRQGVGERLLRECEAQSDLPRFRLMVRQSNSPAIQLYQKLGYAIVGELPRFYHDGEVAYLMDKPSARQAATPRWK